jgi:hypothetical protein
MNRTTLIALQAVGVLSILPYPFVLLANVMSIAAPGHTSATQLPWIVLSFYPIVWIVLYVIAWRAMSRGAVGLAFGLSSIPAAACLIVAGFFVFSWIGFGLGSGGIGSGGLHSTTYPTNNPVLDTMLLAGQDIQIGHEPEFAVGRAIHEIESNPKLMNVSVAQYGSPVNVALRDLAISIDGKISGDNANHDRARILRALIAHGAHLGAAEAADLHKSFALRRALLEGPVTTESENPLVWRIVTHERADNKPFDPLTGHLPSRDGGPAPFELKAGEIALVNRSTRLHGTPLYAALLDGNPNSCRAVIAAGGRLSANEAHDPAASAALQTLFDRDPDSRAAYK